VYVTAAGEKPVYVDFDSPVSVSVLAKIVRRARSAADPAGQGVTVTEMLPEPDRLWLADAAGRRYTAELRVACVDRLPVDPG
jgi:hypothetical protein